MVDQGIALAEPVGRGKVRVQRILGTLEVSGVSGVNRRAGKK
jgi:hypothetical protein